MPAPGFTWIEKPHLAALAMPESAEDLAWLRRNGVELLVSLTEYPIPRQWVNDAGMMVVPVPVPDMEPPSESQIDLILHTIKKANAASMGVAVHCAAGLGRTGTVLAAYFVLQGMTAKAALSKVRELRPGSVETTEQERAVEAFARRRDEGVKGSLGERGA